MTNIISLSVKKDKILIDKYLKTYQHRKVNKKSFFNIQKRQTRF